MVQFPPKSHRDDLIMQMIRYRAGITGCHLALFSVGGKGAGGGMKGVLVCFWGPCLSCPPWPSGLSETGGAWSD